jgi:hypothetical protein
MSVLVPSRSHPRRRVQRISGSATAGSQASTGSLRLQSPTRPNDLAGATTAVRTRSTTARVARLGQVVVGLIC